MLEYGIFPTATACLCGSDNLGSSENSDKRSEEAYDSKNSTNKTTNSISSHKNYNNKNNKHCRNIPSDHYDILDYKNSPYYDDNGNK